jgi:RHS repeat-associated protein
MKAINYRKYDGDSLLSLTYSLDNAHNITAKTQDGVSYTYGYDELYQLTSVTKAGALTESFSYDNVGNRMTATGAGNINGAYAYDDNNRLLTANGNTFNWDENGNQVGWNDSQANRTFEYDIENRLTAFSTATTNATYQYDPQGRRISKTVNGSTTKYLWDGNVLLAELDSTNTITKTYAFLPNGFEPIATTEGTNSYWYLNDHLLTPQKLVDSNQSVVWSAEYKVFGEVAVDPTSTITNNLRFPGQYADSESGLSYNLNRYYHRSTGRYISYEIINFSNLELRSVKKHLNLAAIPIELINPDFIPPIDLIQNYIVVQLMKENLLNKPLMNNGFNYALSLPLRYIDPEGEWVAVVGFIGGIAGVAGYLAGPGAGFLSCVKLCLQCRPPFPSPKCEPPDPDDPTTEPTFGGCITICRPYLYFAEVGSAGKFTPTSCK